MKTCIRLPILKFLLILFYTAFCGCSTVDPRWNTGLLPEEEIIRIKSLLGNVSYMLYNRSKNEWHPLHRDDPIPESLWQTGGEAKLIIHGYVVKHYQSLFEKLEEQSIWELGAAYANMSSSFNVFIVDWTVLATETLKRYYEASEATRYVGEDVARFLIRLLNESYVTDWDKVHLIGFSLGGHTAGVAGAKLQELAGAKIGRITGLDPAGPNFEVDGKLPDNIFRVLDKSDAKFVDIIHCNMRKAGKSMLGHLGSCVEAGHADFFPNGGEQQTPFCRRKEDMGLESCSHMVCTKFMKESVLNPTIACPCESWSKFKQGKCQCTLETGGVLMGASCPLTASGNYFLRIDKLQ